MNVGVDQAGEQEPAGEVDDPGALADASGDVVPEGRDAPFGDADVDARGGVGHPVEHHAVHECEVELLCHVPPVCWSPRLCGEGESVRSDQTQSINNLID